MVNPIRISLDTNVFIFGLRQIDPHAGMLLENLYRFEVHIAAQVERELRKNLATDELREFYELIGLLPGISISYQLPPEQLVASYLRSGLKTGDALIAAFCEHEAIEWLISENRHFL